MPANCSFRVNGICSCQINGIGSASVRKSVMTLSTAVTVAGVPKSMHVWGIMKSQKPCTGLHWNIITKMPASE